MHEKILRCAIYIRVSTAEQAMHGKSLAAQTEYLTHYAEEHNMAIVGVFADEGKTARKNFKSRKAIKDLLEHVKNNEIDTIIFWKMDRWFRNVSDFYKVQDILDAHKTKWIAVAEPNMNLDTRDGRLNLNIMLSINQNETDTTSERIRFVNESSVRQGKVISGLQPFGYSIEVIDGVKRIVKDKDKEYLVEAFYEYYFIHNSKRGALIYINTKYGPVITMRQVEIFCTNTKYYGTYKDNPNYCPAYISKEQWNYLQEINRRNIKVYASRNRTGVVYLFSGLIQCPVCHRTLACNSYARNSHSGKLRKAPLKFYRCHNHNYKKTCSYSKTVNEATIEKYLLNNIESELSRYKLTLSTLKEQQLVSIKEKGSIDKIKKEMERLNLMFQKGRISIDAYDIEYDRLASQIKELDIPDEAPKAIRSYDEIQSILYDGWKSVYDNLTLENKRAFWRQIIREIQLNEDNSYVKAIVFL